MTAEQQWQPVLDDSLEMSKEDTNNVVVTPGQDDATQALRLKTAAMQKRATADAVADEDPLGARFWRREAEENEAEGAALLELSEPPKVGAGNELVPAGGPDGEHHYLVHTVESPDTVTAKASLDRLNLAENADALALGVDAAATIQAQNSLEKMLAHQMAAAHVSAMRMMERAEQEFARGSSKDTHWRHAAQLSASRLMNSAARMMSSYQDGMMALHRLRSGGKQVVVVQHVHVTDGGQAVVAGKVSGSDRGRKGGGNGQI